MASMEPGVLKKDPQLQGLMVELDLNEESFPALIFLPLVYVAWSDGKIQKAEANLIRKMAFGKGLAQGPAADVLDSWLDQRPDEAFFQSGLEFLFRTLQRQDEQQEIRSVLDLCEEVAKSAGGLFGLAFSISDEERHALQEIEQLLIPKNKKAKVYISSEEIKSIKLDLLQKGRAAISADVLENIPIQLQVKLKDAKGPKQTHTEFISKTGLFIRTDTPKPQRQLIQLDLMLPTGQTLNLLAMVGEVVSLQVAQQSGEAPGMSVKLYGMSDKLESQWIDFVDEMRETYLRERPT